MYAATKLPLGANWDTREYIHVRTNSHEWVKYAVTVAVSVAVFFLFCA